MIRASSIIFLFLLLFFHEKSLAQTWTQLEDYPGLGRDDAIAFSIADCGYIVTGNHGGFWESNQMWKYITSSKQWLQVADFPGEKRQYALAFTNDQFAYILGGISENNIPLNDFYRYNSQLDTWQKLDSFPGKARWSAASTTLQKSAFVFGGATLNGFLNDSWRFDFKTESWENLDTIPAKGKRDQLCFSLNDKTYLSCGYSLNPLTYHSETYSYNIQTHTWKQELEFPSEPIAYGTVTNSNNKAIVLGGYRANNSFSKEAWLFDGSKWTSLSTCLSEGIRGMSAFTIDNKHYFLTGKKEDLSLSKDFYVLSFTDENEVLIYPNPSIKNVHCNVPIGSKLEIFNTLGEKLNQYVFDFNNEHIIEFYESGVYFAKVIFKNQVVETKKIVIL